LTIFPSHTDTVHGLNLDPYGRLIDELACKGCGYNLRGQSYNGQCPECGMSVAESVIAAIFVYADPDWLKRLSTGVVLLLCTLLTGILLTCGLLSAMPFLMYSTLAPTLTAPPGGGPVVWTTNTPVPSGASPAASPTLADEAADESQFEAWPSEVDDEAQALPEDVEAIDDPLAQTDDEAQDAAPAVSPSTTNTGATGTAPAGPAPGPGAPGPLTGVARVMLIVAIVSVAFAVVISLLWGAGIWYLTTPEPGTVSGQAMQLRSLLRFGTMVYLVLYIGAGILGVATSQSLFMGGPMNGVYVGSQGLLGLLVQMAGVAMVLGLVLYMRVLARRMHEQALTKQTTIVLWGLGITMGLLVLSTMLQNLVAMATGPNPGMPGTGQYVVAMFMGLFSCTGVLGLLVFGVWGIVLLFLFKSAFTRAQHAMHINPSGEPQVATWNP
jgi:hypothetical protein